MAVFSVHESPDSPSGRLERAETLVFVRDGFSWAAALVPVPWLIVRGEWLLLVVYTVAVLVLSAILVGLGAKADWVVLTFLALNVLFGFEAHELRRALLTYKGWREIGTVSGRTREECERRFFDAWLPREPTHTHRALGRPEVRSLAGNAITARLRDWGARARGLIDAKA